MADKLYTNNGIAVQNAAELVQGFIGKQVRLLKVKLGDDGQLVPLFEVVGILSIADPNGIGELLVTSQTADPAIGNMNYQFHTGQIVRTQPGNPNEIVVIDHEPKGIV
jgi:hypothetical protein